MREVTGPIIATTAVLLAVFVPVAFLPGVTGRLYNQFALTIAISVAISAFNSLTLSPALCAVLLRHRPPSRWSAFRAFNAGFTFAAHAYANGIRRVIGARWAALALFAAGLVLTYGIYSRIPAGFLPVEDQGYLFAVIQLPDGASLQRTEAVAEKVRTILAAQDGVMDVIPVTGTNFLTGANQSNSAVEFALLSHGPSAVRRSPHRISSPRSAPSFWPYRTRLRSASTLHRSRVSRPRVVSSSRLRTSPGRVPRRSMTRPRHCSPRRGNSRRSMRGSYSARSVPRHRNTRMILTGRRPSCSASVCRTCSTRCRSSSARSM